MASAIKDVSTYGRWQIVVDLVSQSVSNNYSRVRVRGIMYNDGGSTSFNNNGISKKITGSKSWSDTSAFSVAGHSSSTIIDETFTIDHDSNGNASVSFTVSYGATGTSTFGGGASISTSMTLDRIPQEPKAPPGLTRSFTAPRNIKLTWDAANNMGATITNYVVQYDDNSSFSSPTNVSAGTDRTQTITVPSDGKTWWFRVYAVNSRGNGPPSSAVSYAVPDIPSAPGKPTLTYTPATTMKIAWSAPSNGGAAITGYIVQYDDNSSFTSPKSVSTTATSITVTDITVGPTWYFRVIAKNSQGNSAASAVASMLIVCGPRVNVAGAYKNTVAYVNVGGVWKTAIPYVNVAGVWKIAGG